MGITLLWASGRFKHFRDQRAPLADGRRWLAPPILAGSFLDVTATAKRLQPAHVPRVLPGLALQRRDVIAFQGARPAARDATPAVALEHGEAHDSPTATGEANVVPAHPATAWRRRCRGGALVALAPAATAMIAAAAASSRARARRPPSLDFASLALALGSMTTRASDIA